MVWLRSAAATRRWRFPKSIPTAAPAERLKDSSRGGRPPCGDALAAVLPLLEHPVVLELAHDARDRRAGETRAARQLGAAGRTGLAQRRHDPRAIALSTYVRPRGHERNMRKCDRFVKNEPFLRPTRAN